MNPLNKAEFLSSQLGYLRKYDIAPDIFRLGPDEARLLTVMNELGMVDEVTDYEFTVNDQDLEASSVSISAIDAGNKNLTLQPGEGVNIEVNQVLRRDNATVIIVTAVNPVGNNVDQITVNIVAGLNVNDVLLIGAPAYGENSSRPAPKAWAPVGRTDYVQTTRLAWGNSRMVASMGSWVPDLVVVQNRNDAYQYIKRTLERGILYGTKSKVVGPPLTYFAGGMFEQLALNGGVVQDFTASGVSYDALVDANSLQTYARSDIVLTVTSQHVIGLLTKVFNKQAMYIRPSESSKFGVRFQDFIIGTRTYRCLPSQHFQGAYANTALCIDPRMGRLVTTKQNGGKRNWMLLQTDAQDPGQDGTINVLTCDWGVRLNNTPGHSIWTGLQNLAD